MHSVEVPHFSRHDAGYADLRFPLAGTWTDAATGAARTLGRRRDGVRLTASLTALLVTLALTMKLAQRLGPCEPLGGVSALLAGLAIGCACGTAIALASLISWRVQLRRLVTIAHATPPALAARRTQPEPRDRGAAIARP